jgi:hypothetical protein
MAASTSSSTDPARHRWQSPAAVAWLLATAALAPAQDVLTTVVLRANAVPGTAALATFGFDPTGSVGGTIYSAGFGSGAELRRIENVGGTQVVTPMVSQSAWTLFLKNGDPDNSGGQPTPHGFLLNPVAVGSRPAYSFAVISDGGSQVTVAGVARNDLTQRLYTYDLGTGSGAFNSLATQQAFASAAGLANPGTVTGINVSRQFAFSGDGQAVYIADNSAATSFGGIYRVGLESGTVTRLLADSDCNTEIAVLPSGGTDTILLRGGGSTGNAGGIDRITFDGTSSARTVHLAAATLADFLETTAADISIFSMAAGPDTSVYFNNTDSSPDRRGIFKLDAAGRLIKVVSYAERLATFGGSPNSGTLRMQPHTVQHPAGFPVTQVLYAESGSLSLVAGAYDFKPGDFDRDDDCDLADLAAFAAAVGPRGGPAAAAAALKFDLNGNNVIDWKDVKILQTFVPGLRDGDANMDLVVDFADLDVLRDNYYTSPTRVAAASWKHGNFASLDPLATTYAASAPDANLVNLVDLEVLANTWVRDLGQPAPTLADLDARGYTGQFQADVMTAFSMVPEPSTMAPVILGAAVATSLRLRWRAARHRTTSA